MLINLAFVKPVALFLMTLEEENKILKDALIVISKLSNEDCRCPFRAQRDRELAIKTLTRVNGPTTPPDQD